MADDHHVEILTAEQVAELLQLNIDYVRKLSREAVLSAHRLPGGRAFRYFKDWMTFPGERWEVGSEVVMPKRGHEVACGVETVPPVGHPCHLLSSSFQSANMAP